MTLLHGGPAFPATTHNDSDRNITDPFGAVLPPDSSAVYPGLSVRDYFAAKAMQGFASSDEAWPAGTAGMALTAYEWADAMLKAREQ